MNISTDLIIKGIAGALAAAAAIGTGIAAKNSDWFGSDKQLTIFDEELINWLETDNNDIVFTVKYTSGGTEKEIKSSSETVDMISAFVSDKNSDKPMKISLKVSDDSTNLKGTGNKNSLKKLNDNKDWTWVCEMTFKKNEDAGTAYSFDEKHNKRVYGVNTSDKDGLFKKLIENVSSSNDSNSKKIKGLKKNFIKNCAEARPKKNQTINNEEIKTPKGIIVFELSNGGEGKDWGNNVNNLYFIEKD